MVELSHTSVNKSNVDTLTKPFFVTVEAPYDLVFEKAYVVLSPERSGITTRRRIQFKKKANNVDEKMAARLPTVGSNYARYLMNCHLWKTEGRILTEDEEVDHVNGNALDDRLDNLEIVSREENIRRRDFTQYASWGVTQPILDTIRSYLEAGENRRHIASEMGITMGYLRYLIHTYFPLYDSAPGVERDLNDIMKRRAEGETCDQIADSYGVSTTTIKRILHKHAPQLTGATHRKERRDYITKRVQEGAHYNDIAEELGCTPTNVWYYIKQHLPEIAKRDYYDKENQSHNEIADRNALIIKTIAPFINRGVRYCEFDDAKWGLPKGKMLQDIVSRHDKDGIVKPLNKNRPKSERPTIEEVMEKHPELKGTLPIKL